MLAILIVLDCYRIGWVAWGLQRITDLQSTLQSKKSPYNPQNLVAIENRVIKDCGRILWLDEDHFLRLFSVLEDFPYIYNMISKNTQHWLLTASPPKKHNIPQ